MPTPDLFFGELDTAPTYTQVLLGADGLPLALAGASVAFRYRLRNRTAAEVVETASIVDADEGVVEWTPAAPMPRGEYHANWIVTFAGGAQLTVPNDRHLLVQVLSRP